MKNIIAGIIILITFSCQNAQKQTSVTENSEAGTTSLKEKGGKPFNIHFDPIDNQQALQIEQWLHEGLIDIEDFFSKKLEEHFDVFIFSERDSLDKQWQKDWNMPDFKSQCWMVASGIGHRLDILSPRIWESQACEHDSKDSVATKKLIIHELVHVFHGQNNPSPTFENVENIDWFVEGLAVYVSGQLDDGRLERAKNHILENGAPSKLTDIWKGQHKYGFAGSIVQFIDQRYGRAILTELITFTKASEILSTLHLSEADLISQWEKSTINF